MKKKDRLLTLYLPWSRVKKNDLVRKTVQNIYIYNSFFLKIHLSTSHFNPWYEELNSKTVRRLPIQVSSPCRFSSSPAQGNHSILSSQSLLDRWILVGSSHCERKKKSIFLREGKKAAWIYPLINLKIGVGVNQLIFVSLLSFSLTSSPPRSMLVWMRWLSERYLHRVDRYRLPRRLVQSAKWTTESKRR